MLPAMFIIMKRRSPTGKGQRRHKKQGKDKSLEMDTLCYFFFSNGQLFVMLLSKQLNNELQIHVFGWMGEKFIVSDYLTNPDMYPKYMLIITWAVGLLTTSTVLPVAEELYFRGFSSKRA